MAAATHDAGEVEGVGDGSGGGGQRQQVGAVAAGPLNGGLWRSATTDSRWGRGIGGGSRGGPGAAN
jgi:hypothetical protein